MRNPCPSYRHVIFSTKHREPIIDAWRELFSVLGGAANALGCQSILVGEVIMSISSFSCGGPSRFGCCRENQIELLPLGEPDGGLGTHFHWQAGSAAAANRYSTACVHRERASQGTSR